MLLLLQVSGDMINYYDSIYNKAMVTSLQEPDKPKAAALVLKVFHEVVRAQLRNATTFRASFEENPEVRLSSSSTAAVKARGPTS